MIVHWMRVGFVHGVMNTDNLSILGLTIDYGPYGWLENYDPDWTPNTTDAGGRRYRFGNQPQIALWNLVQLANATVPLVGETKPLESSLDNYSKVFQNSWKQMTAGKLGLDRFDDHPDDDLVSELLDFFATIETDMTIFYRRLADVSAAEAETDIPQSLQESFYAVDQLQGAAREKLAAWLTRYRGRVRRDGTSDADRRERMNAANPIYVLRNYLAQLAIDQAERGDFAMIAELLDVLRRPYQEVSGNERFCAKRPEWARNRPGCSMLSCSS
jgi:uncharacterized protein YdiU (UPF0061 family)